MRRHVPFDLALTRGLGQLPDQDRRLAHEIAAGVLRNAQALDALLAHYVPRGLASVSAPLLDILRVGAYQLRLLERIPPHAAVATSVALARERVGDRVAGFANAVLRRVAELGHDAIAEEGIDDVARLAGRYSHPAWMVARWLNRYGIQDTERLLRWNNARPALVIQPTRMPLLDLERSLAAGAVRNVPAPFGAGVVVEQSHPERLPGFAAGEFYVQDPAQALVVRFADFPTDAAVYDACAAPGGKTLGVSRLVPRVVGADHSRRRLARWRDNVARAGRGTEFAIVADARHPPIRPVRAFLLDAPCLGTGAFARHPDARTRVTAEALHDLAATQAALLDAAAERTAPGGVLCYATCSLEPEENELQVTAFLARHPEFHREPPDRFPSELITPAGDMATLPHRDGVDGAFAARMVRAA